MAVRLRLELRTRLSPSDGLAIRSNTIIGPLHAFSYQKPLVVLSRYGQQSPYCRLSRIHTPLERLLLRPLSLRFDISTCGRVSLLVYNCSICRLSPDTDNDIKLVNTAFFQNNTTNGAPEGTRTPGLRRDRAAL